MNCENHFCVYQADGICTLDEIHLDIAGSCTECIYIELDELVLTESKHRLFCSFQRETGEKSEKN